MRVKIDDIRFPGIWCGFLLLLIQVQNENKTFRLLTSAFLWKASVFWFELILRISFPIKLRWRNESQCFCGVRFASDTVRLVEHAAHFCLDVCSKVILEMKKGLVRGYSDFRAPSYFLLRATAAPRAAMRPRTGAGEAGVSGSSTGLFAGSSS